MLKPIKNKRQIAKKDFFSKDRRRIDNTIVIDSSVYKNVVFQEVDKINEIKLPVGTLYVITKMTSSTIEFIEKCDEAIIFCNAINIKHIEFVKDKVKGVMFRNSIKDKIQKQIDFLSENNINIKFTENHSKILLLKKDGVKYVVQGSGNPSINARIESYIISQNNAHYDKLLKYWEDA